jgi:hypothetical protein
MEELKNEQAAVVPDIDETPEVVGVDKDSHRERAKALDTEHGEIRREVAKAIALGRLMREGVQTLLNKYGSEQFFDAVRLVKAAGVRNPTALDVIKQLEPDSNKRAELYDKIESDAGKEHEAYKQWEQAPNRDERKYHYYGNRDVSSVQGTGFRVTAYRDLDSVLAPIMGRASTLFLRSGGVGGMRDLVSLSPEELLAIQSRLSAADNQLSRLTAEIGYAADERTEHLRSQAEALTKELDQEIQAISDAAYAKLQEFCVRISADLAKLGDVELASPSMQTAIETAITSAKGQVEDETRRVESVIEDRTKPLKDLKGIIIERLLN